MELTSALQDEPFSAIKRPGSILLDCPSLSLSKAPILSSKAKEETNWKTKF